jgi:hypothetical protein
MLKVKRGIKMSDSTVLTGDYPKNDVSSDKEVKIKGDEALFHHIDQMDRWRKEYEHRQAVERRIVNFSKLNFKPVDYEPLLKRTEFIEESVPDYSKLIDEAKDKTKQSFVRPMYKRYAIIAGLLLLALISFSFIMVILCSLLGLVTMVSIFMLNQQREEAILLATERAKIEIQLLEDETQEKNERNRAEHEKRETERITQIEKLIAGDLSEVVMRIGLVLPKLDIPLSVSVEIDIYENIPFLKVWLPAKTIIPRQKCELLLDGRIKYVDKELRLINKQYVEFCAALVWQLVIGLYTRIPSFEKGYACAISKESYHNDQLIFLEVDRQIIEYVCQYASTALIALQLAKARFECDITTNLMQIESGSPPEWQGVEEYKLRNIKLTIGC